MIEVGLTKTLENGKKSRYKYSDVFFDHDGFANVPDFYPLKYDLVSGKNEVNVKPFTVWWTGKEWLGLRLPEKTKITKWKRIPYDSSTS